MEKEYNPLSYSEARYYADMSKRMCRKEAETIQKALLLHALECGVESPKVNDVIYSITDRFVDEDNEMRRQIMENDLRRRGVLQQEDIEAEDEQIIEAIKLTLPKFQSDRDWGGVYRILVDFCNKCGFKAQKTDFVRRLATMGVYPQDMKVEHLLPATIKGDDWHDHRFSYEAIKKGVSTSWPATFYEWERSELQTRDFIARRKIATTFLKNLRKIVNGA